MAGSRAYPKIQARAPTRKNLSCTTAAFANGDVHIGTALNRFSRTSSSNTKPSGVLAPPTCGWDCHGLPIEFKVSQEMRKQRAVASAGRIHLPQSAPAIRMKLDLPAGCRKHTWRVPPPSARPAKPMPANILISSASNSNGSRPRRLG